VTELARRILFALIAAPLALGAVWLGGPVLATVLAIIAAISAWEFCRIARAAGAEPLEGVAIPAAAVVPLLVHGELLRVLNVRTTHVVIALLCVFAATLFVRGPGRRPLLAAATTTFGVAYVGLIAYAYVLRYDDHVIGAGAGTAVAMFPILLVWATDVGAFVVGRLVGGRRLMPSVSPGKTVSGAAGGVALALIISPLYVHFVLRPAAQLSLGLTRTLALAVILSVVAQIGDLTESLIKRDAGMKDSSTLLPGHGGMLDRMDSLLFVLPVAALLLHAWMVYGPPPA